MNTTIKTALVALTANKLHNTFYAKILLSAVKNKKFSIAQINIINSVNNSAIAKSNMLQYVYSYTKTINKLTYKANKQVNCAHLLQLNAQFVSACNAQQITHALSAYIAIHKQALKNTRNKKVKVALKAIF